MNELFLIIILFITTFTTYLLYKIFDKRGFYFSIVIMNIITFILSFKIVTCLKLNINLGIVSYLSTLTIIYLFIIKYGKKEIKELIKISLYTNILTALFLTISNYYIPAITETISINIKDTFITNYKILITYPIIMLLSEILVTKLYVFVSSVQNNKMIVILLTYIITAILYTIIFYVVAYIKILPIKTSIFIGISTYIVGLVITTINIGFIYYLIKSKKVMK
jgi:uncharacterized PurR-regulated membrane protein YhhQ (DUF165 family)